LQSGLFRQIQNKPAPEIRDPPQNVESRPADPPAAPLMLEAASDPRDPATLQNENVKKNEKRPAPL
jgi:hypothetical protein